MAESELLNLLLGSAGALVLSLTLNWLFWRGKLTNPDATVSKADYQAALDLASSSVAQFSEQTDSVRRLTEAVERQLQAKTG